MRVVPFDPYTLCDACKVIMYVDVLRSMTECEVVSFRLEKVLRTVCSFRSNFVCSMFYEIPGAAVMSWARVVHTPIPPGSKMRPKFYATPD